MLPIFYVGIVAMHIWWNKPSQAERADLKAATVSVNLYFLYCQILGVFETVAINWKPPFSDFLQLMSYMRMKTDFLKPSCGMEVTPYRDYLTRGLIPLCGISCLYSLYFIIR